MADYDDLKRLAEAATPNWDDVSADVWAGCGSGEFEIASNEPNEPIAAYIAAANPARVLGLLAELERLREALEWMSHTPFIDRDRPE